MRRSIFNQKQLDEFAELERKLAENRAAIDHALAVAPYRIMKESIEDLALSETAFLEKCKKEHGENEDQYLRLAFQRAMRTTACLDGEEKRDNRSHAFHISHEMVYYADKLMPRPTREETLRARIKSIFRLYSKRNPLAAADDLEHNLHVWLRESQEGLRWHLCAEMAVELAKGKPHPALPVLFAILKTLHVVYSRLSALDYGEQRVWGDKIKQEIRPVFDELMDHCLEEDPEASIPVFQEHMKIARHGKGTPDLTLSKKTERLVRRAIEERLKKKRLLQFIKMYEHLKCCRAEYHEESYREAAFWLLENVDPLLEQDVVTAFSCFTFLETTPTALLREKYAEKVAQKLLPYADACADINPPTALEILGRLFGLSGPFAPKILDACGLKAMDIALRHCDRMGSKSVEHLRRVQNSAQWGQQDFMALLTAQEPDGGAVQNLENLRVLYDRASVSALAEKSLRFDREKLEKEKLEKVRDTERPLSDETSAATRKDFKKQKEILGKRIDRQRAEARETFAFLDSFFAPFSKAAQAKTFEEFAADYFAEKQRLRERYRMAEAAIQEINRLTPPQRTPPQPS